MNGKRRKEIEESQGPVRTVPKGLIFLLEESQRRGEIVCYRKNNTYLRH